jgi:hypothetical protein
MKLNPQNKNRDEFELQHPKVVRHSHSQSQPVSANNLADKTPRKPDHAQHVQHPAHVFGIDELAAEAPRDLSDVPDGPPPSEKVDFENLPEFVWQRKMLKTVRIVAIFVTVIIAIVLIFVFVGSGKGAKDSLKEVINNQPADEQKP